MVEDFYARFGRRLAVQRRKAGMMQTDLAALSKFKRSTIGGIERGIQRIDLRDAVLLARLVGADLAQLVGEEEITAPEIRRRRGPVNGGRRARAAADLHP